MKTNIKEIQDEYLLLFEKLICFLEGYSHMKDYPMIFSKYDAFQLLLQQRAINDRIAQLTHQLRLLKMSSKHKNLQQQICEE